MNDKELTNDENLLKIYMIGFEDELNGLDENKFNNSLLTNSYKLGRLDAIAGDDVESIDLKSVKEKLKIIKNN